MKKIFPIILAFFCIQLVSGQQLTNDFLLFYPVNKKNTLAEKSYVFATADYSLNSTAITNNFLFRYAKNEFIDNNLKDEVSKRLSSSNRYGYQLQTSVSGKVSLTDKTSFIAGLSLRQINASTFSKDLFNLIFYGNRMFAGKNATIGNLRYLSTDYQSLSLGLSQKLYDNKLSVWGGISVIRGGQYRSANINNGTLYTEPDGSYIETDIDFKASVSNGKPGLIGENSGSGAGIFAGATYKTEKSAIAINITDVGFVNWRNIKTYTGNSTFRFEGKEIKNILAPDDSLFASYNTDSVVKDAGIKVATSKIRSFTPATLKISYVRYMNEKFFLIAGVQHIFNASYLPRIYIRPVLQFHKNFYFHLEAAAGGYGKTDVELGISAITENGFAANLNLFAAELIFAPSRTSGHGISFSLVKSF